MAIFTNIFTIQICEAETVYTKKFYVIMQGDLPLGPPLATFDDALLVTKWLQAVEADMDAEGFDEWRLLHEKKRLI